MMISCRKATELLSRQLDEPLSLWDRGRLRLHLLICHACRVFERRLTQIRRVLKQQFAGMVEQITHVGLSTADRLKIVAALKKEVSLD